MVADAIMSVTGIAFIVAALSSWFFAQTHRAGALRCAAWVLMGILMFKIQYFMYSAETNTEGNQTYASTSITQP